MTDNKKRRNKPIENADDGQTRARLSRVKVWLIDCDDTLYESSRGMFAAIHLRMESFIAQKLGVSIEEGRRLQHAYWARYGATFLACLLQVLRQTNRIRQPKGAGNRLESVRYLQAG